MVVEMDHGRFKHRSQTPSRIPAKVLPIKNSSITSQNLKSSSSTSVFPAAQKESLRSVSAGPRERPVNTPMVSSGSATAQKGGRSNTSNRPPSMSSSIRKLSCTPPQVQAPSPLSCSLVQQAKPSLIAGPTSNAVQPLSSLPKSSKLSSSTIPTSMYHNAENPSKISRSSSAPNSPTLLSVPVVSKPRSPTTLTNSSSSKVSEVSSVSGTYPVRQKTAIQEFHAQRKLRISGYGRNPCLVKASCIVPEVLPRVSQSTWDAEKRCSWLTSQSDEAYVAYHDEEWGVPVYNDKLLFELLVLQGAQAELSQPRILALRENFRAGFDDFDPVLVAKYDEEKIAALKSDSSICIPETKMWGAVKNAKQILEIVDEYGSFSTFLWGFVNNKPSVSHYKLQKQVPVKTPKSEVVSKELIQRGFQFVGPMVMYSVMQAGGLVNDHLVHCFRHRECADLAGITIHSTKRGSDRQTQRYTRHSQEHYNNSSSSNRHSQELTSWVADALKFRDMFGFQSPFELSPYMNYRLPIIDEEAWEKDTDTNTDIESEI